MRVHDVVREVLDVRRMASRTTAAARAAESAGAAEPGTLADGRAGGGAARDPVAAGEMIGDVVLDAPRREGDDARAVAAGEQAQDVLCRRAGCGCAVLDGRLTAERSMSVNPAR
jgi:hypothetical protein